jgi:hypothetical protein
VGISVQDREIQSLVNDIKEGRLLLPEMQRGYVWKSTQVRDLFDSLYHEYPTGQLLIWQTDELPHMHTAAVQNVDKAAYRPQLLLDGQQRLTSLTAILFGEPLLVRDRSRKVDIVFNVFDDDEKFEVATAFHHPQAGWVSLTKLFTKGTMAAFSDLKLDFSDPAAQIAHDRLTRLHSIKQYRYRINVLEGLTYDKVTEIFVRINSGGTRLNSADLALAQMSSRWKGVTDALDAFRRKARERGWELDHSVLLRVLTALLTGQSRFSRLFKAGRDKLDVDDLKAAWDRAVPAMDAAIQFLIHNCGIDRLSMMPTYYVLIPLAAFFDKFGAHVSEKQARDLQRWLYMALIWSRYTGAAETFMDEDLAALSRDEEPIDRMIENILDKVGRNRAVTERELQDQLSNTPFMLMAYILARRNQAKDWFNGLAIGAGQSLEYHHIFPRAVLSSKYDLRTNTRLVNQVANLAFISGRANGAIAAKTPDSYLPNIEEARLRAQYVPSDRALWNLDHYEDFARERRQLLADAINDLLASLMDEQAPWVSDMSKRLEARLGATEQDLRDLIAQRLTANFGPRAWKRGVPGAIQDQVQQRIDQRIKRNPFEDDQYDSLEQRMTQCNFGDYGIIIKSNWPLFEDVFSDKTAFDRQMQAVQDARNAFAHHRELNEGEQQTAAGGLYWFEQCLRRAARPEEEPEEEVSDEENAVLVGVTLMARED